MNRPAGADSSRPGSGRVVFVSVTAGLGGPSRCLATILPFLRPVERVLCAPNGAFVDLVRRRDGIEHHLPLPRWKRAPRLARIAGALKFLWWALWQRRTILAIHANGQAELNLVAPAALVTRLPVVVWAHAYEASPSILVLGKVWRRLLRNVKWAAVSTEAREVLVDAGMVTRSTEVALVPNPIDPKDVVAPERISHEGVTIGFLKGKVATGGFQLLPDAVERLHDVPVRWLLFTGPPHDSAPPEQLDTWKRLQPWFGSRVEVRGKTPRVDLAYAECDIVFSPSLRESFGRVAAEAMLNMIPVVASDIPPLRRLVDAGGLVFPAGDMDAATDHIRRLATDERLRRQLGEQGYKRAIAFLPDRIAEQLCQLYGLSPTL